MNPEHLHFFITEEIYWLQDSQSLDVRKEAPETKEAPVIPVAFFHRTQQPKEVELLHKIIGACKLDPEGFKIFSTGFDEKVRCEKAVVFSDASEVYYESIRKEDTLLLFSKPLSDLISSREEKGKLWSALQQFLK